MTNTLISIHDCRIQDPHGVLFPRLDWEFRAGEAWLVIGANGSGKADFLRALAGEAQLVPNAPTTRAFTDSDDSGGHQVPLYTSRFADSCEIVSLERAARLIEEERQLDETDYMDHVDEGRTGRRFICEVLGGPDAKHRFAPLPPVAARLETLPEVKLCGVENILDRGLRSMSTGEIRRTLLCRALLSGRRLLILSDPFAGLDAQSRSILREFFQTIAGRQLTAAPESNVMRILLAMERYSEIPETITHVLEFAGGAPNGVVSFCGTRQDYEARRATDAAARDERRSADKAALHSAFRAAVSESALVRNSNCASRTALAVHSGNDVRSVCTPRAANDTAAQISSNSTQSSASVDDAAATVATDAPVLIDMRGVNVGWDDRLVLADFTWSVRAGEHWLIRGPNGSGKTTLLELITGDNKQVYSNDVRIFGRRRGTGESIWDIKAQLGIVSYRLHVEYRMVGGTDLEAVIISGFKDSIGLYEPRTDVQVVAAHRWLALAGFSGREREPFARLSYGEQRAVLIVRAAVKQPKLLILDEPCHGLDERHRERILSLLEAIAETGTTTLLQVTHDPTEVLACERHILELRPGEEPMYRVLTR